IERVRELAAAMEPLSPADDAARALRAMTVNDVPLLPVIDNGHLLGVVSRMDIVRGMSLSELAETQRPALGRA
ncbi:MAG: CBS domain-containing protein, partial [Deltaproteobacteria bacterium]|nr:CBS domain-containing protein [Kofleriaceae bacterium]